MNFTDFDGVIKMLIEHYGLWQPVIAIAILITAWKLPEIIKAIK